MKEWDVSIGFYPGILFGIRTYHGLTEEDEYKISHVFYLPLIDLSIDIYTPKNERKNLNRNKK